jgi:histidinol-phosphate aminotransferase
MAVDLAAVARAVTDNTRLILLNNPNNPTGTIFTREAWEDFLEALPASVTVVLDEAYIDFADAPDLPDSLDYVNEERPLVGLRTFSKAYGLAGLRVGYGFGPSELLDYLNRLRLPFNINRLAQVGAQAALTDGEFLERTKEVVRRGRAFLEEGLARLGLTFVPSQANFILIAIGREGGRSIRPCCGRGSLSGPWTPMAFPSISGSMWDCPRKTSVFWRP